MVYGIFSELDENFEVTAPQFLAGAFLIAKR